MFQESRIAAFRFRRNRHRPSKGRPRHSTYVRRLHHSKEYSWHSFVYKAERGHRSCAFVCHDDALSTTKTVQTVATPLDNTRASDLKYVSPDIYIRSPPDCHFKRAQQYPYTKHRGRIGACNMEDNNTSPDHEYHRKLLRQLSGSTVGSGSQSIKSGASIRSGRSGKSIKSVASDSLHSIASRMSNFGRRGSLPAPSSSSLVSPKSSMFSVGPLSFCSYWSKAADA